MSACGEVKTWIEEMVQVPVERFIDSLQQACEDFKTTWEEKVQQPVESWVSDLQETCTMQTCNWWCLCCNKWLCWMAWVLVKVVTWIFVTVIKWSIYTICKTVMITIRVVEMTMMLVGKFVIVFTVCLFTEPTGAVLAMLDLWSGIGDIGEVVTDFGKGILADVGGMLLDVASLLTTLVAWIPIVGPALAGLVRGAIDLLREVVSTVSDIVSNLQDIAFGIGRLDFCRVGSGFTGLGTDVARTIAGGGRIVGGWIGAGIRDEYDYAAVAAIVRTALAGALGAGSAAERMALARVRINQRPFGLPFTLDVRRFSISSRSAVIDLAALHRAGVINLFTAAGLVSDCTQRDMNGGKSANVLNHPRWEVVFTGTSTRVDYSTIGRYLKEGPMAVPDFSVFAIRMDVLRRYLANARRKAWQLGVDLSWPMVGTYELMRMDEIPFPVADNDALMTRVGRTGTAAEVATIPTLAIFGFDDPTLNGLTSWFRPLAVPPDGHPSGVTFRDRLPETLFQWVLIHEIGHYLGLDHAGHNGIDNIMFTNAAAAGLTTVTPMTVAEYLLLGGEPRFTVADAATTWMWITSSVPNLLR